jgi:predicted unusual protein kinase regulating ubiquinone biosynthesis (AarF/ABC1/UbiB family)
MIVDRNKSARGSPLRVHMIDCGLTVELGERDHKNLVKILGSLIKRDGYAAGKLMVDTAKKCQATELDVEMFCRGMEKICVDDEDNVSCEDELTVYNSCVRLRVSFLASIRYSSPHLDMPDPHRTFSKASGTTSRTFVT